MTRRLPEGLRPLAPNETIMSITTPADSRLRTEVTEKKLLLKKTVERPSLTKIGDEAAKSAMQQCLCETKRL